MPSTSDPSGAGRNPGFCGVGFELREKLEEEEDVGEIFHLH